MLHDEMRRSEDRDGISEVDIQGCWAEEDQVHALSLLININTT